MNAAACATKVKTTCMLGVSVLAVFLLSACASAPVQPTYVSSAIYKDYSCAQLEVEYKRVSGYIANSLGKTTTFDTTGIGVGVTAGRGGIYPRVSVGMGRSSEVQNTQLSRMLGERDAVAEAARFKGCSFYMPHLNTKPTPASAS